MQSDKYIISNVQKSKGYLNCIDLGGWIENRYRGFDLNTLPSMTNNVGKCFQFTKKYGKSLGVFNSENDAIVRFEKIKETIQHEIKCLEKISKVCGLMINCDIVKHQTPMMYLLDVVYHMRNSYGRNVVYGCRSTDWTHRNETGISIFRPYSAMLQYGHRNIVIAYFFKQSYSTNIKTNPAEVSNVLNNNFKDIIRFNTIQVSALNNILSQLDQFIAVNKFVYIIERQKPAYPLKTTLVDSNETNPLICSVCGYKVPEIKYYRMNSRYANLCICAFCAENMGKEITQVTDSINEDIRKIYETQKFTNEI